MLEKQVIVPEKTDEDPVYMAKYIIREATTEDVPQILELHFNGLRESNSCSADTSLDTDLYNFTEYYPSCHARFLVAVTPQGVIMGMGAVVSQSTEACEIKRMRVSGKFRRQGVAQGILNELLAFAARRYPGREIHLDSSQTQTAAHRLYEKNGFVRYAEKMIGGDIPSYLFRKSAEC